MRKLITIIATALIPVSGFGAEALQQGNILATQVTVTRDALDQVLGKLKNAPASQVGSNPDFVAQAEAFNARVEQAMLRFEDKLKNEILKEAAFYVDRLQAIWNSKAYSWDQKSVLYHDQLHLTRVKFSELSEDYKKAVYELYTLDLPKAEIEFESEEFSCDTKGGFDSLSNYAYFYTYPIVKSNDPRLNFKEEQRKVITHDKSIVDGCESYRYSSSFRKTKLAASPLYRYFSPKAREIVFTDVVRKGCYSASCLALYSNHRVSYVSLIRSSIDKKISFEVMNDTLTLQPLDLPADTLKKYFHLIPGESKGLPFEVSAREFEELSRQAKRDEKLDELKKLLLNPPGEHFFSSYSCPARVAQIKEELCQSELRCLTDNETKGIETTIDNADVFRKGARIDCLNGR